MRRKKRKKRGGGGGQLPFGFHGESTRKKEAVENTLGERQKSRKMKERLYLCQVTCEVFYHRTFAQNTLLINGFREDSCTRTCEEFFIVALDK